MSPHWLFREPSLSFGAPVYLSAVLVFPFLLGWIGASLLGLAAYVALTAALFTLADALTHAALYRRWVAVIPQAALTMLALALPAILAFALGSAVGS